MNPATHSRLGAELIKPVGLYMPSYDCTDVNDQVAFSGQPDGMQRFAQGSALSATGAAAGDLAAL